MQNTEPQTPLKSNKLIQHLEIKNVNFVNTNLANAELKELLLQNNMKTLDIYEDKKHY